LYPCFESFSKAIELKKPLCVNTMWRMGLQAVVC
jgi:hypothetical protein